MSQSRRDRLASPARRHFFAVATTATVQMAALASVLALSSTAKAASSNPGGSEGGNPPRGPHCFLRGTHIRTPLGETRIEDLRIGDHVLTMHAGATPIRWIGRNTYRKERIPWRKDVAPIRIIRSAIEDDLPHRDLYLSAGHGLFIGGFLIPAIDLANDLSIASVVPEAETLEYFQIETDKHALIWAEGLPVETFDGDYYEAFDNVAEFYKLYPEGGGRKAPVATNLGKWREHLKGLLAAGVSIFGKRPDPFCSIYTRIADRAANLDRAA